MRKETRRLNLTGFLWNEKLTTRENIRDGKSHSFDGHRSNRGLRRYLRAVGLEKLGSPGA
jgi:hypothetical protein